MSLFGDIDYLPLRLIGLDSIPAVPIELDGLIDTALKVRDRSEETIPVRRGLSDRYTIGGRPR